MRQRAWKDDAWVGLVALAIAGLEPRLAHGKAEIQLPPDLEPPAAGIIELKGDHVHNCGNVLLHLDNRGLIGSAPGSRLPFAGAPSAQWPAGSPTEYLYIAGLWVGALKNGDPHVTTAAFQIEWRPGKSELDRIYTTREGLVGGARAPASNADDDRDGKTDEDWLDGRDNDNDGRIDEDFAAISNQMYFCEYGDSDPAIKLGLPEHVPLDLWVQQSSLCWEAPLVDDFIAFDFRLINKGFEPLEDVYISFFADCDVGPRGEENAANDDYAGFWEGVQQTQVGVDTKNVKVSIGYMWDDDTDEGKSDGYIGLMFLGAQEPASRGRPITLRNFRFFSGRASFEQGGDPGNDAERYAVLNGRAPRSLPPADPVTGLHEEPFPVAKKKDDYRMTASAGPFGRLEPPNCSDRDPECHRVIAPGDTLGFQAALVIGSFFEGMLANAIQAQLTFDGAYLDCDENPATGVLGRETPICGPEHTGELDTLNACNASCVGASRTDANCYATVPPDSCIWINADCKQELQTGIQTGIDGKECLIHWLIGTAPPPPNMRLIPKENEIDVLWDNRSETTPDLRLSVIDFESYRIWRADNWTRPIGTDVNTGPGANLWMLLSEFDQPHNGIGSDSGLEDIRYRPAIPDQAVDYYREWFRAHPLLKAPVLPGFTEAQLETAQALARGTLYYRFVDPPFTRSGAVGGPCPSRGGCPDIQTSRGLVPARCNRRGVCQETIPPPHTGANYFYSVTATDHKLDVGTGGTLVATGPGLAGDPSSNFVFITPPTDPLSADRFGASREELGGEIYVIPNPATPRSMQAWALQPNNLDPTGIKIEFHHLPATTGKVTVFSLAGDVVKELSFDGRSKNGSLKWDLVSRNGQDVTSGVYLFTVEADDPAFKRFVGKFVVIR